MKKQDLEALDKLSEDYDKVMDEFTEFRKKFFCDLNRDTIKLFNRFFLALFITGMTLFITALIVILFLCVWIPRGDLMNKKKRRKEKFEIDDFDDPEIRNLIHKLNGILEDIDDLEYEQEEHESRLQSLKEKMEILEGKRKELEDEISSKEE